MAVLGVLLCIVFKRTAWLQGRAWGGAFEALFVIFFILVPLKVRGLGADAGLGVDVGLGGLGADAGLGVDVGLGGLGADAGLGVDVGLGGLGAESAVAVLDFFVHCQVLS